MLNTMAWAHKERDSKKEREEEEEGERLINMIQTRRDAQNNSKLSKIIMKKHKRDRDRAAGALTGGLVAAFRDSISVWVIHTLLVD